MSLNGVYMAYPIDQIQQVGMSDLSSLYRAIDNMKNMLLGSVCGWVYDPGDAFKVDRGHTPDEGLARINRAALNNSDAVVAFLPAGVPSIGVPMEIDRAVSQGKAVVLFSDAPSYMLNYPYGRVIRYNDWTAGTLMEAAGVLAQTVPPEQRDLPSDDLRVLVGPRGTLPVRQFEDDAGLDLVVSHDFTIEPGTFADVPCDLRVELPYWSWGLVTGRSSALRKRGLLVHSGIIDAGYRGPLYAGAWNMTDKAVEVKAGERLAQLIIMTNSTRRVAPIQVEQLTPSERGEGGFGSTGV